MTRRFFRFGRLIDARRVPINLQVGDDADAPRGGGNLAAQIRDHGSFQAGGESHILDDTHPFTLCVLRFHVRRDDLNARLIRGIHGSRGEIVGVAVQKQAQGF